jgi:hypothetical protein
MISTAQEAIDLLAYGEHNEVIRAALAFIVHAQHQQGVQLTAINQEIAQMSTAAVTQAQALQDLTAADTALKAAVTQILTYIQTQAAAVESVAQDMQAQATTLLAAIAPPPPVAAAPVDVVPADTPAA